jgi:hypothetical protein
MIRIGGSGPWTRCAALALSVVLVSVTVACTSGADKTPDPPTPGSLSTPFTMSFAGAAVHLSGARRGHATAAGRPLACSSRSRSSSGSISVPRE